MPLTACITGATGFLGRQLTQRLLNAGLYVRCLIRQTSDVSALTSLTCPSSTALTIVKGSLTDPAFLRESLNGADVVYHVAAGLAGSPSSLFLNTVVPTRTLMAAGLEQRIRRFVLVSSMGVYGTATLRSGQTVDEHCPIDPRGEQRDPYTFSKIRQEQIAWNAYREQGLPLVVIRPGVIYGPGRSPLTSRVGLAVGPLFLRMGGGQLLPYTHVINCADAIALAGQQQGIEGQAFNVVDDQLPTGSQILRLLKQQGHGRCVLWIPRLCIQPLSALYNSFSNWSAGQLPPVLTPYKSAAIWKSLRYSNHKAQSVLHWKPGISILDGLEQVVSHLQAK